MNEDDPFQPLDDMKVDDAAEEFDREMEKHCKEIDSYLWKKLYTGYEIISEDGLIFITNKTKTKYEQLKWLKKYSEELQTHGIDAKVYDDGKKPYICI